MLAHNLLSPSICTLRFGICFAGCVGIVGMAHADGTLTLDLPPSPYALQRRAANAQQQRQQQQASASRASARGVNYARYGGNRGVYPSRHQARPVTERVVGRLGQLAHATPIHRTRSAHSPTLTTAPAGTYLAIQEESDGWCGVLMADGSMGWLPGSAVQVLDYQVVSAGTVPSGADSWLPGGGDGGDVYPRTSIPFFTGDPQMLLNEAYRYLGVPYVWGGNTSNGIDCSGLVKRVYAACGFNLPRLGSDQMAYGIPVSPDQLQPGDRLYFFRRTERLGVKHTGIYIGNGYFIHASTNRHGVAISRLSEPNYNRAFVCARR